VNYAGSGNVLTRRDEAFGALARHSRQPGIVHKVPRSSPRELESVQ
jgi:hypothetical protein